MAESRPPFVAGPSVEKRIAQLFSCALLDTTLLAISFFAGRPRSLFTHLAQQLVERGFGENPAELRAKITYETD
ncbi:MAG: hypothetical protein ACREP5_14575, partial [Candidatus Binatia bacterium]